MVREIHPVPDSTAADARYALARREVFAAIDMVAGGAAPRVAIANLAGADDVAAEALVAAQAAGVAFRLVREGRGRAMIVVGPILDG